MLRDFFGVFVCPKMRSALSYMAIFKKSHGTMMIQQQIWRYSTLPGCQKEPHPTRDPCLMACFAQEPPLQVDFQVALMNSRRFATLKDFYYAFVVVWWIGLGGGVLVLATHFVKEAGPGSCGSSQASGSGDFSGDFCARAPESSSNGAKKNTVPFNRLHLQIPCPLFP